MAGVVNGFGIIHPNNYTPASTDLLQFGYPVEITRLVNIGADGDTVEVMGVYGEQKNQ